MKSLGSAASEFRDFLLKQNALALAVGVVIGAAIGKVVGGLVDDVIMPVVGLIIPGGEWRTLQLPLSHAADGSVANAIKYGDLAGRLVDFIIVSLVVFVVTKALLREKKQEPTTRPCPACLEQVPRAATRCRACTSTLVPT
jgi:large conductance mechanosensitive channel